MTHCDLEHLDEIFLTIAIFTDDGSEFQSC